MCPAVQYQNTRAVPAEHVERYVCVMCGNLLRERSQSKYLPPVTLKAVGWCCREALRPAYQNQAMKIEGIQHPRPQSSDQRALRREEEKSLLSVGRQEDEES